MRTKATGPDRVRFVIEEGDAVVLTDHDGVVVTRPQPAPPIGELVINYSGRRLENACWVVLAADGTLAFQSEPFGMIRDFDRVVLTLDGHAADDHLTPEDHRWLKRVTDSCTRPRVRSKPKGYSPRTLDSPELPPRTLEDP